MKLEENSINKIPMDRPHGTATLKTKRLTLRKHKPKDAQRLFEHFGDDDSMSRYSGWNPYKTPEMARNTVQQFIDGSISFLDIADHVEAAMQSATFIANPSLEDLFETDKIIRNQ